MSGIAYLTGFNDARDARHTGWFLLQLAPLSDRELSDYWHGWHAAKKYAAKKTRPARSSSRRFITWVDGRELEGS